MKVRELIGKSNRIGVAALCLIGLMFLIVSLKNVWSGTPEAKLPQDSLFFSPNLSRWSEPRQVVPTQDFERRPLFSESRRPLEPMPDEPEAEAVSIAPVPLKSMEGWTLVGIFNSGEVEGAIVRQTDGSRDRVLVGGTVDGWTLLRVGPRRAVFRSVRTGQEAELTMSLAALDGLVRAVSDESVLFSSGKEQLPEDQASNVPEPAGNGSPQEPPPRRNSTIFGGGHRNVKKD